MEWSKKEHEILTKLKIHTFEEVVTYFPFRYEEIEMSTPDAWEKNQSITFGGQLVQQPSVHYYRGKQSYTKFHILLEDEIYEATIFNRPWVANYQVNELYYFQGKYQGNQKITLQAIQKKPFETGIIPIYHTVKGVSQEQIKALVQKGLARKGNINFIDEQTRQKYRLCNRSEALHYVHQPPNQVALKEGFRHLKYEEFLKFQLQVQYRRLQNLKTYKDASKKFDLSKVQALIHSLPFTLSEGQLATVHEILDDLHSVHTMHRLVQGDVGCGKTIVSFIAGYANILAGYQSVLLAPTQILAKQHYENACALFKDTPLRIGYLDGSLSAKAKAHLLEEIKAGRIDFIIGTHALLQEHVEMPNVGLAMIDEQQRFGVEQRSILGKKGDSVDQLFLSATPIPRTLAFSLFGDMEVSCITSLPKNRLPKYTKRINKNSIIPILDEIKAQIKAGNQIYVVCPAIVENEGVRSVESVYEGMKKTLKGYQIGFVHGKLKNDEKNEVMEAFKQQQIQILIATSVIEVGVDVPNANVMVIYDAHHFGLSQLHQLRGRVGRHERAGYCYLLSDSKEEEAIKRLEVLVHSQDGFEIAKEDLKQRGFGDLLGQRQSGMPIFKLANIVSDEKILEVARKDAQTFVGHLQEYPMYQIFLNKKVSTTM